MKDKDIAKLYYHDFARAHPELAKNDSAFSVLLRELDQAHKSDAKELTANEVSSLPMTTNMNIHPVDQNFVQRQESLGLSS